MKVKYCPKCGTVSRIVETRTYTYGDIFRRRVCPKCGYRYSTIEIMKEGRHE